MILLMSNENKNNTARVRNKKARHNYEIINTFEAGISLQGSEVKSLRMGSADLNGTYARIINNECFLIGCKIEPYKEAGSRNHITDRNRKLLLHSAQIRKLKSKLDQRGFSLVPLSLYFNDRGLVKVELALARGKRLYDKREALRKKDQKRELERSAKRW